MLLPRDPPEREATEGTLPPVNNDVDVGGVVTDPLALHQTPDAINIRTKNLQIQ